MSRIRDLGVGVGLRVPHYPEIFASEPQIDFFEIISENFMVESGPALTNLHRVLERFPVVQHGVSMSIASAEPLDFDYLARLKKLVGITGTPWLSDHLCWTRGSGHNYHDLLPIPYTAENARFVAEKARIAQDYLEVPLALENLSSYVSFRESTWPEWAFYTEVVERAGIHMMLDVNNVYVSSVNHRFDPMDYLRALPMGRVIQVHVAGHTTLPNGLLLDTHDHRVCDEVWALYRHVCEQTGGVSTVLEWDDHFLSFAETRAEALRAVALRAESARVGGSLAGA